MPFKIRLYVIDYNQDFCDRDGAKVLYIRSYTMAKTEITYSKNVGA